jgi:hypothetical protein
MDMGGLFGGDDDDYWLKLLNNNIGLNI